MGDSFSPPRDGALCFPLHNISTSYGLDILASVKCNETRDEMIDKWGLPGSPDLQLIRVERQEAKLFTDASIIYVES